MVLVIYRQPQSLLLKLKQYHMNPTVRNKFSREVMCPSRACHSQAGRDSREGKTLSLDLVDLGDDWEHSNKNQVDQHVQVGHSLIGTSLLFSPNSQ